MKKLLLSLLLVVSLTACGTAPASAPASASAAEEARTRDIAVLYTGDVHVALENNMGYDGIAALKKEMTGEGMEVLLVDTGDAIQGSPIGKLSDGQIPIEIMNELGYCAMAIGNHEFDYGTQVLASLSKQADFPFLSLDFVDSASGKSVYKPYS